MQSYKILALIGCVLGLLITIGALVIVFGLSNLSGKQNNEFYGLMVVAIVIYISALTVTFAINKKRTVGIALIVSAVLVLILTSGYGIIGFGLLLPAGITRLAKKEKSEV
jgi:cytochrome bd-type quinol oxidase subunit 2